MDGPRDTFQISGKEMDDQVSWDTMLDTQENMGSGEQAGIVGWFHPVNYKSKE